PPHPVADLADLPPEAAEPTKLHAADPTRRRGKKSTRISSAPARGGTATSADSVPLRATSARGGTAGRGPARAARSSAAPDMSFNGSESVREDCLSTARAGPSPRGQIEARS